MAVISTGFHQVHWSAPSTYFVLNGISSHKLVSPLILEQDFETRQFHVSTDRAINQSVIFTSAERRVWDALRQDFKYADVKRLGKGSGYRMFQKAKDHALIFDIGLSVWRKTQESENTEPMEPRTK